MVYKKILGLLLTGSMILLTTACGAIEKTVSASNVAAATPKEVLEGAATNFEVYDSIDSMTADMDYVFNIGDYSMTGKCSVDAFVKDMKVHCNANYVMDDENMTYDVYSDTSGMVYSTNEEGYKKIDFSGLNIYGMDIRSMLSQIQEYVNSESDEMQSENTDESSEVDIKQMLEEISEMSDIFTLDGTKEINGMEVYVVKGVFNKENIDKVLEGTGEDVYIPEELQLPIEIYVSTSGYDFAGVYMDLANMVKLSSGTEEEQENYMQICIGVNNAESFDIPEAEAINILEIMDDTSEISTMFGGFASY